MNPNLTWVELIPVWAVGLERATLPGSFLRQLKELDIEMPGSNDTEIALEALGAARLLDRVLPPLTTARLPDVTVEKDGRQVCPPEAVRMIQSAMNGLFSGVLDEFFALLGYCQMRLPSELLPDVLDYYSRQKSMLASTQAALGPSAQWLALQHPVWSALYATADLEWHTATFVARQSLLRSRRAVHPVSAQQWVASTWQEDPAEARSAFLAILAENPLVSDTDFLQAALQDRSHYVREIAFGALMRLPESEVYKSAVEFFEKHLVQAIDPSKCEEILRKNLPELNDEVRPWVRLLSAPAKVQWREGLLELFLKTMPISKIAVKAGKSGQWIKRLAADTIRPEFFNAILESIACHRSEDFWSLAVELLSANPDHPGWKSNGSLLLRKTWPFEFAMLALQSGRESQNLYVILSNTLREIRKPWPKELIRRFLLAAESYWGGGFFDMNNPPVWLDAIQSCAYCCNLEDATQLETSLYEGVSGRPGPLQVFYDIVNFRKRFRQALS